MLSSNPITKHGLDLIDISPLDYWHAYLNPHKDEYVPDQWTIFDKALRCAVFEPEIFSDVYVRLPKLDRRNPHQKMEYDSLEKTCIQMGQILIPTQQFDYLLLMRDSLLKHKLINKIIGSGNIGLYQKQTEPNTDAVVSFTPHFIMDNAIINLTSTKDASLDNFQKEVWDFKHHKKAALQMDLTGMNVFIFITIERSAPFKIGIRTLDARSLTLGRDTYLKNCETYIKCLEKDSWPGITEKITTTSLPDWVFNKQNS